MVDAPASLNLARQGAAVAGSAAVLAALWLGRHNIVRSYWDAWIFWVPFTLLLATVGGLCLWFAVQGHRAASRRGMVASWGGGALVGGVAFLAGFVGPLIATPAANLGDGGECFPSAACRLTRAWSCRARRGSASARRRRRWRPADRRIRNCGPFARS
jgi:hypothetical protein